MAGHATTPVRLTRSRANTPLPAIQARQSHAYGAQGKAALQGQVTQSHAAIDEAFHQQMREPTPKAAAQQPRRGRKAKTPAPTGDLADEESALDPEEHTTRKPRPTPRDTIKAPSVNGDDTRPGTALQDSAMYDCMPPPPPPPPPARTLLEPKPSQPIFPIKQHEPSRLVLYWRTLVAWLPSPQIIFFFVLSSIIFLGLMCLLGCIVAIAPIPSRYAPRVDEFFRGIRIAAGIPDRPPEEAEYLWLKLRHGKVWAEEIPALDEYPIHKMQFAVNWNLLSRIRDLENGTADLDTRVGLAQDAISELQRILPNRLVVVEDNGELVIPATFWQALLQRMQSPDASPLWDHFLTANQARVTSATNEFVERRVSEYAESQKLISSEEFQQAIVKSQNHVEEHFSERLRNFQAHVLQEARAVASEVMKQLPKMQLEALALSNLLRNIDGRLREINYMSIGLGAMIDPHYTSSTFRAPTALQRTGRWLSWATGFSRFQQPLMLPNPPIAALLSWEEGTECWCAAPSADEKALAQLTVKMPRKIYPKSVVIEHVPATGTRDILAAPKDFEVWVQVDLAAEAERIKQRLDYEVSYEYYRKDCGNPPNDEKNWVCILSDYYDIHYTNYVQVYTLNSDAYKIGLLTDRVAVRVTENWGGDHTCLYRVRLSGSEQLYEEEQVAI